jgi:hypothetical protein
MSDTRKLTVVEFKTDYKVANKTRIKLKTKYGFAQMGRSAVWLGQTLVKPQPSNPDLFVLNDPAGLAGQIVDVKSIVSDINSATNQCSLIYSLRGGTVDEDPTVIGEVEKDGDPCLFHAKITLIP